MERKHTERQHTVPKFLLKNFSSNGKTVRMWDRVINSLLYRAVGDACVVNDIYDVKWKNASPSLGPYVLENKIEKSFVEEEGRMAALTKRIENDIISGNKTISLSADEEDLLFDFLTSLLLRTVVMQKSLGVFYGDTDAAPELDEIRNATENIFDLFNWGSAESLFNYLPKYIAFCKEIEGSPYNVERERFGRLKYVFWYSPEEEFVISSFPLMISIDEKDNIKRVLLPISSRVAIVLFDELSELIQEGMVLTPGVECIRYNMLIYAKEYSKEVARFFIAKNEETLNRLFKK